MDYSSVPCGLDGGHSVVFSRETCWSGESKMDSFKYLALGREAERLDSAENVD